MKTKIIIIFIIIFSLCTNCLYAQNDNDMSLFEIDRLIRKTEYDEALRQLNIYIEKTPENFDNAQIRIRRIMNARKQYSILAEKLITLIQNDPGNNKEIYEITAQLEKFERHPSDQNLQFIADLKKSAEFNYFRSQFLEIQNATAESSNNGDYIAAIEKAKSGFWLYKDSFYEKWEDNPEITQSVDSILLDLDNQIAAYEEKNFIQRISATIDDFIKAVNQDQYEQALNRLTAVENALVRYNSLRDAIIADGVRMQQKFAELKEIDEDATDASFLPFMFRFVFGVENIEFSGILGAIDSQWNAFEKRMNDAVFAALTKKYENSKEINNVYVNEIAKYVSLDNKVMDLYKIVQKNEDYILENPYKDYYVITDYVKQLSENTLLVYNKNNQIQEITNNQNNLLTQIENTPEVDEKTKYINQLFEINSKTASITGVKDNQLLSSFDWAVSYAELEREDWTVLSTKYSELLDNIFIDSEKLLNSAWENITEYYKSSSDKLYADSQKLNESSERYTKGFFTKIPANIIAQINSDASNALKYQDTFNADPELDFGINYSYPDISVKICDYTQKKIDRDISSIDGYKKVIASNFDRNEQWKDHENVNGMITSTNTYLDSQKEKLTALKTDIENNKRIAQAQIVSSQLAKNEADLRFTEAETALRSENFDMARKKLQDALSKYDESLNAQNDETLRTNVDAKLQSLGERIAKTENERVVREVRDLKTKAKDAYFNGRFDDAEKYLNQAKIRWAVTNVTEDEEITNLLNFVNTAISMKTGREILPSAPQYPEMSQLLNIAYQYFDEGNRKIGSGFVEEGNQDLDKAMESIQKLQYVYPLNQEAALLTLRINRLKDPQKFKEEFAQKVEMAKLMCQSKNNQQEGYANLLDYYELDPNYPGLKNLIYQVEIQIGIRQKPVDNSGAQKAKKLVNDAQAIYNSAGNDVAKLQKALEKVDQALALVSDNNAAITLKDKITTKIGGNTSTVLSTEDERLYQLAIQRLQNNNVVGAKAIVEQLLKKPQNANSQKIKELKNKIEARS